MGEKKYSIEVTEEQLRLIANCVEDCHRFMSGQYELAHMTQCLENRAEIIEGLKNLKPLVTPDIPDYYESYSWNGSGCKNNEQRKFIAKTYPIYREILHFLSVKNKHDNTYSSATLTCDEGGAPITIKEIK